MMPKISVVMSVYNGKKYLKEAIESILNQTFKDFEFIIINDGSTDKTERIIKNYNDLRIKLINNKKNIGLTKSLNKGLRIAKGKYIVRQDADDVSLPRRLEKQINVLEGDKNLGMVASWIKLIDEEGKYLGSWPADRANNSPEEIYYTLNFENCLGHSSTVFRKKIIAALGGYNELYRKSQDYELWQRLSKVTKIKKLKKTLVLRRKHKNNTSVLEHQRLEKIIFIRNMKKNLGEGTKGFNLFLIKDRFDRSDPNFDYKIKIFKKVNQKIIDSAPVFLDEKKLKKCVHKRTSGERRIKSFIKNFLRYINFFLFWIIEKEKLKITKKRKNILFVVPYIMAGGAERIFLNIAKGLDKKKYSCHIVATKPSNKEWLNEFQTVFKNVIVSGESVINEIMSYKLLSKLVDELKIDIYLTSNSVPGYNFLPQLKEKYENVKTVDILHAEESTGAADQYIWTTPFLDRRICISRRLKKHMRKEYQEHSIGEYYLTRLRIIRNGIDTEKFRPKISQRGRFRSKYEIKSTERIITYLGRFSKEKNPFLFIDIAKSILDLAPEQKLRFVMAGDGPKFKQAKKRINRYGIKKHFLLPGTINNVPELLEDSYLLLITSKREGTPVTIMESMAKGVPVVSTNVGAISEIIENGVNGILISGYDNLKSIFAHEITRLLNDERKYTMATKTREVITNNYSFEKMAEKYQSLFEKIYHEKTKS